MQPKSSLKKAKRWEQTALVSGAIGVVFGDIGTSPLYAVKVAFSGPHAILSTADHVLGVLSLIFWSLIAVVSLKYAVLMMRADNKGEGGIMALMALALRGVGEAPRRRTAIMAAGLFGTALFFGDGIITPAISVMSAVEGLEVVAPGFGVFVVPLTLGILTVLFLLQHRGTAFVGELFSPIMALWFITLAVLGTYSIAQTPSILAVLNPWHAAKFLIEAKWHSLVVLGAVVLVVTGAEAFYADMGHFGVRPIRRAWFCLVLPALALNYLGQGALLLRDPGAADNPFYLLAPSWSTVPLLGLATFATIIASQAVISGAFSIAWQAVQLEYLPRLHIVHTSTGKIGQIYIPTLNWILLAAVAALVLGFGSSSELAAAYGIAVTGTMVVTTVLAFSVLRHLWHWNRFVSVAITSAFLIIDLAFLFANSLKIAHGGWFPLLTGTLVFIVMSTWKRGRELLLERLYNKAMPLEVFLARMEENPPVRVPGTAVYLTAGRRGVPQSLLHNLATNKVLHERVIILTVVTQDEPWVPRGERVKIRHFGDQLYRVRIYYGFNQEPSIPDALALCREQGLDVDLAETSFFLGRENMVATPQPGMAVWRERLFIRLARNAESAMDFWRIPPDRVVELGLMVEL
jgi:KUP system potassium uptake protein